MIPSALGVMGFPFFIVVFGIFFSIHQHYAKHKCKT